nr:HNH endonuclease [Actinomycetota bacterium]
GVALNAAREKVRVARKLEDLPDISEAFSRGELSYSKVRALTRVATSGNEAELADLARHATASHLETLVRAYRGVLGSGEVEEANRRHENRYLRWSYEDDGSIVIRTQLPPEDGTVVVAALQKMADAVGQDVSAETSSPSARNADAFVAMAETALAAKAADAPGGDRYQVVLHVDSEVLDQDGSGRCELEDGPPVAPETARRLSCDASVVAIQEDGDGEPLSVGRKTRSIPPAIRRALKSRDGGCRFPGCSQRRFVDGHHVRHWAHGGETSMANLVLLCRRHHRLVHEGGFALYADGHGHFEFTRPDASQSRRLRGPPGVIATFGP